MVVDGQDLIDGSSYISSSALSEEMVLSEDMVRIEGAVLTEDVDAIVIAVILNAEKIYKVGWPKNRLKR